MDTTPARRVRNALVTLTLTGAASGFLGACSSESDSESQTVYCVDEQNQVVDPDECEDAGNGSGVGGGYFFFVGAFGGNSYRPGDTIPNRYTTGSGAATRVDPSNAAARASAGLPRTGPVASGSRVGGGLGSGTGTGSSGS